MSTPLPMCFPNLIFGKHSVLICSQAVEMTGAPGKTKMRTFRWIIHLENHLRRVH
jgi:hypothetical protein